MLYFTCQLPKEIAWLQSGLRKKVQKLVKKFLLFSKNCAIITPSTAREVATPLTIKPIDTHIMSNIITAPSALALNAARGINVLTTEEIAANAPSAFARDFSEMRTDKYTMFNTADIIEALAAEGFVPTLAYQHNPKHSAKFLERRQDRMEANRHHQRHLIRFTHVDHIGGNLKDERPELVLVNSHNGACSYQLSAGIFRLVCSNGLVIKSADFGCVNIRHEGHSIDEVVAASLNIASKFNEIYPVVDEMKKIRLNPSQVTMFALQSAKIKFGDKKFEGVRQLVEPLRQEDADNTLWNVFNRAQENLIRGGRKVTQRVMQPVERIEEAIRINGSLWELANSYRLKNAGQLVDVA